MNQLSSTGIDTSTFPTADRIFGWIEYLAGLGHRKTGTPQGRASADYIADQLRSFGIENVTIETAPTPCPTVHSAQLAISGRVIECFWVNGTGRGAELGRFRTGIESAEIVYLGHGWEADFHGVDITGKIVVCDIEFKPSSASSVVQQNPRAEMYDPDGSLQEEHNKFDIYSPYNWPNNFFHTQLRGAVGFVGVLQNYMDCYNYNEDYTENGAALGVDKMEIPAVWVSKADGAAIRQAATADGGTRGTLLVDVEYELKNALNVNAVLPGLSSDIILVHSHHDAVFAGAVQDASGVSEVLALAEYFAGRPLSERPKTLMFAATDTHFTDYVGHLAFLEERRVSKQRIVLDLCIEHVGKEIELGADNQAVETGHVEPRLVYISDESGLYSEVRSAFMRNGLGRTFFLPVEHTESDPDDPYVFHSDEVVSDAYYFAEAGIPVVSLVAGQMYLFHPSDTLDRVPVDQLRPVGLAFAEIAAAAALRL